MGHPVQALLARVAAGDHPPADGTVTVLPPPDERSHGVLAFTAHHVVIADVTPEWVRDRLPPGDLSAPLNPPFLAARRATAGRRGSVLVTRTEPGRPAVALRAASARNHARVV